LRILIIEDDADIRAALSEALVGEGYSVSEARDGIEGLQSALAEEPDLILLDLMMPRMDGWAFRAAQQANPRIAGIPVVIVSAAQPQDLHDIDAAAHLHKPFELGALLEAVERCGAAT
jgi:CheY-like chemotaxis protein